MDVRRCLDTSVQHLIWHPWGTRAPLGELASKSPSIRKQWHVAQLLSMTRFTFTSKQDGEEARRALTGTREKIQLGTCPEN